MSRALAGARQRRAGITQPEPQVSTPVQGSNPQPGGLTLPQVIALVDTRLLKLEQFMKETQENGLPANTSSVPSVRFDIQGEQETAPDDLAQVLTEYESRFMLLAEEMAQLKDTLMKLQTYTMDVNKMLLEERVNVLSDLGSSMTVKEDAVLPAGEIQRFSFSEAVE
jgi:hypothetical protein